MNEIKIPITIELTIRFDFVNDSKFTLKQMNDLFEKTKQNVDDHEDATVYTDGTLDEASINGKKIYPEKLFKCRYKGCFYEAMTQKGLNIHIGKNHQKYEIATMAKWNPLTDPARIDNPPKEVEVVFSDLSNDSERSPFGAGPDLKPLKVTYVKCSYPSCSKRPRFVKGTGVELDNVDYCCVRCHLDHKEGL